MTDISIDVKGVSEVQAALERMKAAVSDMTAAHELAGAALAAAIGARTPVRSGLLASSWSVQASPTGATVANTQLYAAPVEYGTIRMVGAHMAERTLAEQETALAAGYESSLADAGRGAGF
jgi:hypothetical protein